MCGCTSEGGSSGFGSSNWTSRLRYQVVSNGFTISYASLKDAKRHKDAHGGQIKILQPGQTKLGVAAPRCLGSAGSQARAD